MLFIDPDPDFFNRAELITSEAIFSLVSMSDELFFCSNDFMQQALYR